MSEIKIIQFEIVSTGKAVLQCAYCEGKGGTPSNYLRQSQKPCPVCGGNGIVLLEYENEPFIECSFCEGKGGIPSNYVRESQKPWFEAHIG